MPEVELGTFLAFLVVPILSLVFMGKIRTWGLTGYVFFLAMGALSFIMLGALTLLMAGEYDVFWTTTAEAYSYNQVDRNSTGDIITNSTITIPEHDEKIPIITDYQNIWSYVFGGFVVVFGLSYFYVMVRGGP